jgi:hypothetical protein
MSSAIEEALEMSAWEYLVMRQGSGDPDDLEAPAVYTPGLNQSAENISPQEGCCLWVVKWSDGAAIVACLPADKHPEPLTLYGFTFGGVYFPHTMAPANRLPA